MQPNGHRKSARLLASSMLGLIAQCATAHDLRIDHVTIVSSERVAPLRDASVFIHEERIANITRSGAPVQARGLHSDIEVVDGRGLFLTPGLIDSHVHLGQIPGMSEQQEQLHPEMARAARDQFPLSYLQYGYTTLVDLNSTPESMSGWKGHALLPETYFCGAAPMMDGYPMNYVPQPARYRVMPYFLMDEKSGKMPPVGIDPSAHTPQAVVAAIKSAGAICVKTFFEHGFDSDRHLPVPSLDTIRALVQAAHAAHLPVFMHANSDEAQTFALDAGVDIIAHGLWNWDTPTQTTVIVPPVKSILDRIIESRTGWQPTIQVMQGLRELFNPSYLADPDLKRVLPQSLIDWYGTREGQWFHDSMKADLTTAAAQSQSVLAVPKARVEAATRYLAEHQARLLFGTDTPSAPTYGNLPGLNGWHEMQQLSESGVTATQIFEAATLSNARALHLEASIGTVQKGKRANLLLLRADPRQSIQAYSSIVKVILAGRMIDPANLRANRP